MSTPPASAHQRILIVEDDAVTRDGLAALLADAGYATEQAGNLKSAMDAMARTLPDLVITDVRLQGFNGLQLLAMSPDKVPTIVITGFPDRMLEADARKMGADYIVKPLSPGALLEMIRERLQSRGVKSVFSPARRWARKPVPAHLQAWIHELPVRILDISYGGLRLCFDHHPASLPQACSLTLPSANEAIDVNLVWQRPAEDSRWQCGAAIPEPSPNRWRQIVDGVPAH